MVDCRNSYNVIACYFILTTIAFILTCHGSAVPANSDPDDFPRMVKVNNCPDSWKRVGDTCIFVNKDDLLTWGEARQECHINSAHLLVLNSVEKQDWLLKETVMAETDGWWLGLMYYRNWHWVNSMKINETVTPWTHEPSTGAIGAEEDCVAIYSNGNFTDKNCKLKYGYFCKYKMLSQSESCPTDNGWRQIDDACYYVSDVLLKSERLSWSDARSKCRSLAPNKDTDLLSVSSADEMSFITSNAMSELNGAIPWWTGLNDKENEGVYVWADKTPADMNLITWDASPNLKQKHRNCAVVHTGGLIRDQNCDGKAFYICEMPAIREFVELGCNGPNWLRANHDCYLFSKKDASSWSDARDTCIGLDSQLLDVSSLDEKYWIEWESSKMGRNLWWTGLNKKGSTWTWVNGKAAETSLIEWVKEPSVLDEDNDCGMITSGGSFLVQNCVLKTNFICKIQMEDKVTCPSKPKKWVQHKNYCYYFSLGINDKDKSTWFEVPDRCRESYPSEDSSITRLTIESKEEKEWLESYLASLSKETTTWWTGLNDRNLEGAWKWADESKPDMSLIKWDQEPSGDGKCAVIFRGEYATLGCNKPSPFICKKSAYNIGGGTRLETFSFLFLVTSVSSLHILT